MTFKQVDEPKTISISNALKLALFDHHQVLMAYITKQMPATLRSTFDPIDVVQDVYFEALRRADQFVAVEANSHSRWLMTIARNRVLYLLRRQKLARRVPQPGNEDESLVSLLEELARYERTPSASAASHETRFAVEQSVERLSPAHAQAIRWRFLKVSAMVKWRLELEKRKQQCGSFAIMQ